MARVKLPVQDFRTRTLHGKLDMNSLSRPKLQIGAGLETTQVIDAGARYGLHPTWRAYDAPLGYHMFEPDPAEAERLRAKYSSQADSIVVHQMALGETAGTVTLNIMRHRGLNSIKRPNPKATWFSISHPGEAEIVDQVTVGMTTIDESAADAGIEFDFLKCDVEGSAYDVLAGAHRQLHSAILGVRSEVDFIPVYEGCRTFGEVDGLLRENGFALMSLETNGAGAPVNGYHLGGRFGYLETSDGIWIKPFEWLSDNSGWSANRVAVAAFKLSAFCFCNGVTDVAIQYLEKAAATVGDQIPRMAETDLYKTVDRFVQKLFKDLEARMVFSEVELDATYRSIFGKERKKRHEFYEDPNLNP